MAPASGRRAIGLNVQPCSLLSLATAVPSNIIGQDEAKERARRAFGGKKALFDLGVPPDIKTYAPTILSMLDSAGWDLWAEKHVADILKANGIDPAEINSVIWR